MIIIYCNNDNHNNKNAKHNSNKYCCSTNIITQTTTVMAIVTVMMNNSLPTARPRCHGLSHPGVGSALGHDGEVSGNVSNRSFYGAGAKMARCEARLKNFRAKIWTSM